jgi:hypothetical protein
MRLSADVLVRRSPEAVAAFMGDIRNIPRWDRGVGGVRTAAGATSGAGYTFETLGTPGSAAGVEGGRMAYEVTEVGPQGSTVKLTSTAGNARYFKDAAWHFRLDPAPEGTRVTCIAVFSLRARYLFLAPVLYLMRGAIKTDLEYLRREIESYNVRHE